MLTRSEVIDLINDLRWLQPVQRVSDASAFHHLQWLRLLRDRHGHPMWAVGVFRHGA